jgi:DNA repair exonuclease SbcCD ATPase subunit
VQKAFSVEAFPEAREVLIAAQDKIKEKTKTLQKVQKDELFGYIRNTFDKLAEKFVEYKRVTDEEAATNYAEIKPKVDAAVEFAKNATIQDARDTREKLIETQNIIKEARLKREQKDELFTAVREVFNKVNEMSSEERKKYDEEANKNYNSLLPRIEVIIVDIQNALDFRTSVAELTAVQLELKVAKLKREQLNKLFNKVRYAFDLLSEKRNEYDKRKFAEKKVRLTNLVEEFKQKNAKTNQLLEKDKEILVSQQAKLNNTPEDNTALRENYTKIINEINVRIADKEKMINKTNDRIKSIEQDIEKTNEIEANIAKNRNARTANKANENKEEPKESPENNNE